MTEEERLAVLPNIYMERAGKNSRQLSEKLIQPPEHPLSPEEAEEALAFEKKIVNFEVDADAELTIKTMCFKRQSEALMAPPFFADAFIRQAVHVEGLEGPLRQLKNADQVYEWLARSSVDGSLTPAQLRDLAKQSGEFYRTEVAQALLANAVPPKSLYEYKSIVVEPIVALRFARAELRAREHLQELWKLYPKGATGVNGARRAFIEIYTKKVNGLIAADIPVIEALIAQSELIGDTETIDAAYEVSLKGLRDFMDVPEARARLNTRLDYIRNGIGYDAEGHASAVDEEVVVEPTRGESEEPPVYSHEERETLMNTEISGAEVRELCESILEAANLLSSEDPSTWAPGRGERAADNLYQVVVHPTKDSFAVNGIDGVFIVPRKTTLYAMLTTMIHELEHINQMELDREVAKVLEIGLIKGRRILMLRETGGNLAQRKAEKILFGSSKPVALNYARALQAFEDGADLFGATKVFYDQEFKTNPQYGQAKAANLAADRVTRLILGGGAGSNSQPMSYAEENIMNKELGDAPFEVRQRATAVTNLDLDDQLRLHQFGLLPVLTKETPNWLDIVREKLQPYITKALAA